MIARKKAVATKARRSGFVAKPSELGVVLSDLRKAKGFSLREVEQAIERARKAPSEDTGLAFHVGYEWHCVS